jgi:hypothetical protein
MEHSANPGTGLPDLSRNVTMVLPFALLGGILAIGAATYGTRFYDIAIKSELGLIENGNAILALAVAVLAARAWPLSRDLTPRWFFKTWLAFFILGGVFLALEEISWGQHFFNWASPDYFRRENLQRETNIHNLWHMSEIIPKFLLHTAAIFGGIVWPLVVGRGKVRAPAPPEFLYWLMPTQAVLWTSTIAIAVRVVERILANSGLKQYGYNFKEFKELNELFLILFVVLYLASLTLRAGAYAKTRTADPQADPKPQGP